MAGGGEEDAVNKAELVEKIAQKTGLSPRDARTVVDAVFDPDPSVGLIAAELVSGGKVAISGFGTFEARERKARTGRNPQTGATIQIGAKNVPKFTAGKALKDSVNP